MRELGHGEPPCRYAVAVLGSAGRGESLLAMDQDNALVFDDGEPAGAEDRWFETFGGHVADILHEAGVPYCKGGVMAKNAQWRGSVATWRAPHRALDRALGAKGPAVSRYLLRHARRCTAMAVLRWRSGARPSTRPRNRSPSPSCWSRRPASVALEPQPVRQDPHRGRPHRPEEGRTVRHRRRGAGAGDPPSRGRTLDAGAAGRRQGARSRRRKRSRRA